MILRRHEAVYMWENSPNIDEDNNPMMNFVCGIRTIKTIHCCTIVKNYKEGERGIKLTPKKKGIFGSQSEEHDF